MIEVYLLNLASRLDEPVEKFLHYFTARRQENILRYKFTADRNRTLWAELLVRAVIAKKFSRTVEEVQIERDLNGKPYVVDGRLMISLAHSDNWAACSVGEVPSGVDVEENFSDALTVAENIFTAQEYRQLCKLEGQTLAEKFLSFWTIKESFVKFIGRGIDDDFAAIDATEILSGLGKVVGRNFFLSGAVVGICTERNFLPESFTVVTEKFFQTVSIS